MAEDYSFACTHWALGSLVLVGLAASEYSGAGTVVALPIAAIAINLSVLCGNPTSFTEQLSRKRKCGDAVDFLAIWIDILEHLASAATCARVASATVDYTSGGRLREWLFGLESHSLGEPWPDVLGVTITIVITGLFMLGLEKSFSFSIILYIGVAASFLFFAVVGGYHTDIKFWNWTDDFMQRSWGCVLKTAAMCAFGFANTFPSIQGTKKYFKFSFFVIVPLICYSLTSIILTLMSHYRELAGTAIPLVRVFEVRDVDWARPVMAVCTISVVCVALTEIIPSLYELLLRLSEKNWNVLVHSMVYRSTFTGAPVLAIFAAGSLASILAFACPLSYLVGLLNVSCLLKCSLRTCKILHDRFKPEFCNDAYPVYQSDVQYTKLDQEPTASHKPLSIRPLRTVFNTLPAYLRKARGSRMKVTKSKKDNKNRKAFLGMAGDKEYLLLGDYTSSPEEFRANCDSSSENENSFSPAHCSDAEDSSSSTDIDVVVQEYRERIQVATVKNFSERTSTVLTSLITMFCIALVVISSIILSVGISVNKPSLAWPSLSVLLLSTLAIVVMPENLVEKNKPNMLCRSVFPVLATISVSLNTILACVLMEDIWPGILLWNCAGLLLFWRCDCCTCEGLFLSEDQKARITLRGNTSNTEEICKERCIDTVLVAR